MLEEELGDILAPLKKYFISIKSSPEVLLLELRSRLEAGNSTQDILKLFESQSKIRVMTLVAKIAWYSKFNINVLQNEEDEERKRSYKSVLIKPSLIQKFSALTDEQATYFIDICIESGIMRGSNKSAYWIDNLVPDGAIALELKRDIIDKKNRDILPTLIDKLDKSESLNLMIAIMDIPLFDAMLEFPNATEIRKLLTPQVAKLLAEQPTIFNEVASSVFAHILELNESEQEQWIPIITLLYPHSIFIQDHCKKAIESSTNYAIYLAITFNCEGANKVFYAYSGIVEQHELLRAALKYGNPEEWVLLLNLIFVEYGPYDELLGTAWRCLLAKIEPKILPNLLQMIFERLFPDYIPTPEYTTLGASLSADILSTLVDLYRRTPQVYETCSPLIKGLLSRKLRSLVSNNISDGSDLSFTVRWFAYHHNRYLVNLTATFSIQRRGQIKFAVPSLANGNNNIDGIRSKIREGYHEFELLKSGDRKPGEEIRNEVVGDGFPPGYDYSPGYPLFGYAWQKIGANGKPEVIAEVERKNGVFPWRAVFKLPF
jgi:hypothetical protein